MSSMIDTFGLADIFGADGLIAGRFGDGYEVRQEQIGVAQTALAAITGQVDALLDTLSDE